MKRYSIIASLCLINFISNANAALPTGATLFDVNVPSLYGGAVIAIKGLHWETSTTNSDYALTYPPNGTLFPLLDGGTYHSVVPDPRWNIKLDIGYVFYCSGNQLMASYLNYHQDTVRHTELNTFNGFLFPALSDEWPTLGTVTISDPSLISPTTFVVPSINSQGIRVPLPANPNTAVAKVNIDHNAFDLDYGQNVNVGCNGRLKYYGGLRYANLKNELDVTYRFQQQEPTGVTILGTEPDTSVVVNLNADFTETVNQSSDFGGIGPHLGVDFTYHLRWGFGLVSSLSSSILAGRIDTSLGEEFTHITFANVTESNIPTVPVNTVFSSFGQERSGFEFPKKYRVVPNIDAKLGLDYTYQYCNASRTKLTLEAGYMVSQYYNAVDRVAETGVDAPELRTRHTVDVHFDGIYVGIQMKV